MQCLYCDSQVEPYPSNGICPHCGARLRPDDSPRWQSAPKPAAPTPASPTHRPVRPVFMPQPGINCCPRCGSAAITAKKRGFGWIVGLIGLFCLPPFGLLLGLIGSNTLRCTCGACRHTWKRP